MRYFLIFISIIISYAAFSQNQDTVNVSRVYQNERILKSIEKQYTVRFFYKKDWFQNVLLKKHIVKDNLDSLLELTFSSTYIKYHRLQSEYVVLTKDKNLHLKAINKLEESINEEVVYSINDHDLLREELKKEEKRIRKIGIPGGNNKRVILSGNVAEILSGQKIEGVAVYADDGRIGTATDKNGNYNLVLTKGYHVLHYQHVAMESAKRLVEIYSGGKIIVKLIQKTRQLEEVRVLGEDEKKEREIVGFEMLKLKEIEELPTFMGEVDIIKQSLLLPGIQSSGEADMSFSVRGGKGDQNLVLIEGMHTYSYSHFFGFFPNVNPYTLNKVNIYKASIPIKYGNRISSVYDLSLKSGDYKKFTVEGGISPITGNLAISGPILKDKITFSIAGRSTYSDYIFDKIDLKEFENSSTSFYDYQTKINYKIGSKSSLSLFYNRSYDNFSLHDESIYNFYNEIGSLNWKYINNEKTSMSAVLGFTTNTGQYEQLSDEELSSIKEQKISDWKLNINVLNNINIMNTLSSGIEILYQQLNPWSLYKTEESSIIKENILDKDNAILSSLYINDTYKYSEKLTFDFGLRYMMYFKLGSSDKYIYEDDNILEKFIIDTINYSNNELDYFDHGLDIRMSGSYDLYRNQKLNFSYNRNNQYIHLITNSQGVTPTDSWLLSDEYINPQIGNQFSVGYNVDFLKNKYFASLDIYYKKVKNIKDFINGSEFEYNPHPETEIVEGDGKSYGIEILLKKNIGRLSGFISYTYSRSFVKSEDELREKIINNGDYYPASNDKPHNLSAVINIKPTRRLTLSSVVNYSSGTPVTLPVSKMYFANGYSFVYSDRNEYRMPYYFRWDASLTFKGSLKKKRYNSTWTLSVYNITARKNAYSIYYKIENNNIQGYKLAIIGETIPTITYKFSF